MQCIFIKQLTAEVTGITICSFSDYFLGPFRELLLN